MAKWKALRKYADDYPCSRCHTKACNPSILFTKNKFSSHCPACLAGYAVCPDCNVIIMPTAQHSGGGVRSANPRLYGTLTGYLWNGECTSTCPGQHAAGLQATLASLPSPAPVAQPVAAPAAKFVPEERDDARRNLSIKLQERVREAISTMLSLGHLPRETVVVLDLDDSDPLTLHCLHCNETCKIRLERFADIPFSGTVTGFSCKQLSRKKP